MSLIGIHESHQGSEIISIRVKQYIVNNSELPIDIGLGPDDIVTLQKKLEKKSDKGNKNKIQEHDKHRRSSTNEKQSKLFFDISANKRQPFEIKNNEDNEQTINEKLLLFNDNKLYSHSPGGFNLNSQASFPAYFSELLRRSTPTQKKPFWHSLFRPRTNSSNSNSLNKSLTNNAFSTSYDDSFVSKGCYYSYNAFTHKDVIVTVDNPGGCQTMMINNKGEFEDNLTNDDWKQVCLSSKLRFYRCSQPLLSSFMFSKPIITVCYYVYEIPYLNSDEFEYCMENYTHDPFSSNDDFEISIAMALIVNCELKYVLKFIEKYDAKFPRLLLHVIKHIAPSSRFCKMLIPVLTKHMMIFSDDVDVAAIFFDIALANMKYDICTSLLIPLLKSSIWAMPQCGVSIARFCIMNNLFEESLEFLNLACVVNARKQKKNGFNNQEKHIELKTLPRSRSLSESNKQSKPHKYFYRSTSMTLSFKKEKKRKSCQKNSSNEYEYEMDNANEGGSNLGLSYNDNNEHLFKSISSSQSSRLSSSQNSRKNSYIEEKNINFNCDNDDDSEINQSSKNNIKSAYLARPHQKSSYIEEKSTQSTLDYFNSLSGSKIHSSHNLRKNSYIEDNYWKAHQHNDFDFESFSNSRTNSRPSSKLSSAHSSRKNSYIEDTSSKSLQNCIDSISLFDDDIADCYFKLSQSMTTPTNSLSYGPSPSSCILLQNHFVTLKSQILFTLSEFIDKLGEAEFESKKDEFIKERAMADEEEMIFDDEIYTSYFFPQESLEEEEEEEFVSYNDKKIFSTIYDDSDEADNDNYDYYILASTNDQLKTNFIINEEQNSNKNENKSETEEKEKNKDEDDKEAILVKSDNYNNNDEESDTTNLNDKNETTSQSLQKFNNTVSTTNSITIPKLPPSSSPPKILKHNLFSNIKMLANKAKNRIFFKINGNDNDEDNNNNNNNSNNNITSSQKLELLPPMSLFDPGIDASFEDLSTLPDKFSQSMPVSNFFLECLSEIRKDYVESMLILAHQKDVTMSTQTTILFISLVTNDKRLMEAMLNSFTEENRATGTDKLILLRGFTMNVTSNLEAILTVPLEPLTVIEKNALAFMEPFAIGIHRLNNTEL